MAFVLALALIACWMALWTKTVVPSAYQLTTLDENLAVDQPTQTYDDLNTSESSTPQPQPDPKPENPPMVYYSAAGSGVAEVRVILSGFVLHGFLGARTLIIKLVALILSVASGMSLGKEGPYVHMAACVGNILCRLFSKYDRNDGKRREVISAAAAAGVAVAFGAPLGGVLFGLEEVSYFFPAKTLFRTFFCCIVAALSLKFLNPYGTHKIVLFEVRYLVDWEYFELGSFIFVGIIGGALGALFIKASKYWAQSFRRIQLIKKHPLLEVSLVALVTGLMSYWNPLTKLPVAELLLNVASPCEGSSTDWEERSLCPGAIDEIPPILFELFVALLIKGFLTVITFGIVSLKQNELWHKLIHPTESSCWDLCTIYGCWRLDGSDSRPYGAMGCATCPRLGYLGRLCIQQRRLVHPTWCVWSHCSRCHHVWCDKTVCHTRSYLIRAHR